MSRINFGGFLASLNTAEQSDYQRERREVEDQYANWANLMQGAKRQFEVIDQLFTQIYDATENWATCPSQRYLKEGKSQPVPFISNGHSFESKIWREGGGAVVKSISLTYANCHYGDFSRPRHIHGLGSATLIGLPANYEFISSVIDKELLVETELKNLKERRNFLQKSSPTSPELRRYNSHKSKLSNEGWDLQDFYQSANSSLSYLIDRARAHPVIIQVGVRTPEYKCTEVTECFTFDNFINYDVETLLKQLFMRINSDQVDLTNFFNGQITNSSVRQLETKKE